MSIMKPDSQLVTIDDNLEKIKQFIDEVIIKPKQILTKWTKITNDMVSTYDHVVISGNGIVLSDYSVMPINDKIIYTKATILTGKAYYLKPKDFTAKTYSYTKSSAIKVTSKGKVIIKQPGTYTVTCTNSAGNDIEYTITAEKPSVAKTTITKGQSITIANCLTGVNLLLPTGYNRTNKKITVSSNGVITGATKGTSKVSVYYGKYKVTGKVKVN